MLFFGDHYEPFVVRWVMANFWEGVSWGPGRPLGLRVVADQLHRFFQRFASAAAAPAQLPGAQGPRAPNQRARRTRRLSGQHQPAWRLVQAAKVHALGPPRSLGPRPRLELSSTGTLACALCVKGRALFSGEGELVSRHLRMAGLDSRVRGVPQETDRFSAYSSSPRLHTSALATPREGWG
jgi:hypothetical protein